MHSLPLVSRAHSKRPPQGLLWWSECYILSSPPYNPSSQILLKLSEGVKQPQGSHCTQTADKMRQHIRLFSTRRLQERKPKRKRQISKQGLLGEFGERISQGLAGLLSAACNQGNQNSRMPSGQRAKVPKQPASETPLLSFLLYLDMLPQSQVPASKKDYELLCCRALSGCLWIPGFLGGAHRSYLLFLLCRNKLCWQVQAWRGGWGKG